MLVIEDIIAVTGYSKNTIYSLSVALEIKPKKGLLSEKPGKGVYTEVDLKRLLTYKGLIAEGVTKENAYVILLKGL